MQSDRSKELTTTHPTIFDVILYHCSREIEFSPDTAFPYVKRGSVYREAGRYQEAIQDFTKALTYLPNEPNFLNERAITYQNWGDFYIINNNITAAKEAYGHALEDYTQVINLIDSPPAYCMRGNIRALLGHYDEAIEDYQAALQKNPCERLILNIYYMLANTYQYKGASYYKIAIENINIVIKNLQPKEADILSSAHEKRAELYTLIADTIPPDKKDFIKKYLQEAIKDYEAALHHDPKNAELYKKKAILYTRLEDYAQGKQSFQKFIQLNPNNPAAYCQRAIFFHELKEYAEAIRDYDEAIRLKPKEASLFRQRAMEFYYLGQYASAIEDYTQAIALEPQNPANYRDRSILYKAIGILGEAFMDERTAYDLEKKRHPLTLKEHLRFLILNKHAEIQSSKALENIPHGRPYIEDEYTLRILSEQPSNRDLENKVIYVFKEKGNWYYTFLTKRKSQIYGLLEKITNYKTYENILNSKITSDDFKRQLYTWLFNYIKSEYLSHPDINRLDTLQTALISNGITVNTIDKTRQLQRWLIGTPTIFHEIRREKHLLSEPKRTAPASPEYPKTKLRK